MTNKYKRSMPKYRRSAGDGEVFGAVIVFVLAVAFAAAVIGSLFTLTWNLFVVEHLQGATKCSFGAAVLAGLGVCLLLIGSRS